MVPVETQETTDCLDGPVMVASANGQEENESIGHYGDVSSTELPLNVEESLVTEENNRTSHDADADAILGQEILEEFGFPFQDPAFTLEIQGSPGSDQGAQGTCSSSEQLASRAASSVNEEGGVQPPISSYGGSTANASADTSLPNNPMGQNPHIQFPLFTDPFKYELEKLRREEENLKKSFEETTLELKVELERKMAEARSEYDRESKELDAAYKAKAMEEEANRSFVEMSSLLANAFMSKCVDKSGSTDLAAFRALASQDSVPQQQAVQANTHMISTVPPRPSLTAAGVPTPNPSGPLSQFLCCTTTQPSPISQQTGQTNTHMISTAPPQLSVAAQEAPMPNPAGPLWQFSRGAMTQLTPISQQAVQTNRHMNSTAPTRPSVTAAESPMPTPSGPLSPIPGFTTTQPRSTSQQAQVNTHVNSTAPPRPSVTEAESSFPNPSGPLSPISGFTTTQPRSTSQLARQGNTHVNSTAAPRPSVTAAEPLIPNPSGPLSPTPRLTTTQPTPTSQQAAVESNTHTNWTAVYRPSLISESLSLHSLRSNTPQPRPPPIISNLTPASQPMHGVVRAPAPHLQAFRSSRAPISSAAATTTHPRRLVQEQQQQQQGNSHGGLVYLSDDDDDSS